MRLFTSFHGNLDFSALPDGDRPVVIERCYWPLLDLPERYGIPIGFEMSARTLRILAAEDPEWVKSFRALSERGLVEPIASGWAQIVAPLAPTEVNRANLLHGRDAYAELLGFVPQTFFVNEQTFSDGLVPLYEEAGAQALVMEWNNPAAHRPELRSLRCQPARLDGADGPGPILLWNDSIVFQKVQRYAHGATPMSDVFRLIDRLADSASADALCIYGGDVEIFDYRPSRPIRSNSGQESEMARLVGLFRKLAEDDRFDFVLPHNVVEEGAALPCVHLGSAQDPIPCKKQPRYNPTRWAVSGRDGFGMNTRAHEIQRLDRAGRALHGAGSPGLPSRESLELWRSDFRTRATEEKVVEFEVGVGIGRQGAIDVIEEAMPPLSEGEDLLIANPGRTTWDGSPVEIPLRLPAGMARDLAFRTTRGPELGTPQFQIEVMGRHRDGSIRAANLVLDPVLASGESIGLSLRGVAGSAPPQPSDPASSSFDTRSVRARFVPHRGGALAEVGFPAIGLDPVIGTIPHGTFDEIAYTPDFYSGHVVAITETGAKHTDLKAVTLHQPEELQGPIRRTLRMETETEFGLWKKTYRIYHDRPRIDLIHELAFHEARLASLRLGTFTLLPRALDPNSLRFGTVNGGAAPEWHRLGRGTSIEQSRAVSASVSATSCLGATEGWVAIEDDHSGVLISGDRTRAAAVPLLDFQELGEGYFGRLQHTAAETDETRAAFLRGKIEFSFSLVGYRTGDTQEIDRTRASESGLVYRTEQGVGISSCL